MLDAARVTHGIQMLDICCGPGVLTAGALERGAEVIGLDFSVKASMPTDNLAKHIWRDVRYWPKADISFCAAHFRFRG